MYLRDCYEGWYKNRGQVSAVEGSIYSEKIINVDIDGEEAQVSIHMRCHRGGTLLRSVGFLFVAVWLVAFATGCESVTKSTVAVSKGIGQLQPMIYAVLPFDFQPTPEGQSYQEVYPEGVEVITTMFVASLVDIVPMVVDRNRVADVLRELEFQNVSGLTDETTVVFAEMLNADAVVSGYLAEYNSSRVSVSVTATHVRTGVVLWSGDVTARVGWVSLDIESAAERAIDRLVKELRRGMK